VQVQRRFKTGGLPVPKDKPDLYERSYAKLLAMIKMLHDSGVPIVAGTDDLPGLVLQREIEVYVEAGLTPADAIYTATLGPARVMKRDKHSGSIAKGKDADLVLIDGDPLANIKDIRNVVTTVKSGVVYSSNEVFETVGIAPVVLSSAN
jgi:imidazolonepropionase-like amidohydrolase